MMGSIGDVYYVLDRQWRFVQFNAAAEAFFGESRDALKGRTLWEMYPPGANSPFAPILIRAMEDGVPGHLRAPSQIQVGRIFDLRAVPFEGEGIGVSVVDITDRARADETLREMQERLDLAVGAHEIGIFDWDLARGRSTWNREMQEIFGMASGAFDGRTSSLRRHMEADDLAALNSRIAEAVAAHEERAHFEFRIRRADGAVRWLEGSAQLIYGSDGELARVVGTSVDVTERKLAEQHQKLLVNELNHRVKNTLATVQAIAWQSFRAGGMAKSARETFEGRIFALAAAHDVLTGRNWESGSIAQIVAGAVAPHDPGGGRFTLGGPAGHLDPKTAVALALAIHELATNAVKYGALSTPSGRVDVTWTLDERRLHLTWRESGGPVVREPTEKGFGARLLEHGLTEQLQGKVSLMFDPQGVICVLDAPLEAPSEAA